MQNTISILLVADDQKFLSQVTNTGQRGGDLMSKGLVNRMQSNVAREMQRYELPNTKAIGDKAGENLGYRIAQSRRRDASISSRGEFKEPPVVAFSDALRDPRNPLKDYEPKKRQRPRKSSIPTKDLNIPAKTDTDEFVESGDATGLRFKNKKKTTKNASIRDIKRANRKDNLFGDEQFENLGPFAPLPKKKPASKKGTLKNVPTVKPIKPSGATTEGLEPFKILPGEQDVRQDPLVRKALEQRAKAQRQAQQRKEAEQRAKSKINSADQKIRQERLEENAVASGDRFGYAAKKQNINDRYDNKKSESLQLIEKLKFERQQKINLGGDTGAGIDYTNQIKSIQEVMVKNEELRKSELRVLEVQKLQNEVIAKRKITDQGQQNSRDRRDEDLKSSTDEKITALEGRKVGLTDKVAIAGIDQEITDVRNSFKKAKEINNINDSLNDLNTNKNRLAQNRQLGINDPRLNGINFDQERNALVDRKRSAESNYQQQKASGEGKFSAVVDVQNQKSQQQVEKEILRLQELTAKSKTEGISPTEKVKLELEVDQAKVTAQFDKIKTDAQEVFRNLQQRQETLIAAGINNPQLNKLISDTQKIIEQAGTGKAEALNRLTSNALLKATVAETLTTKRDADGAKVLFAPSIAEKKSEAKRLSGQGRFLEASVPGRAAALDEENIRYIREKSDFNYQVAKTRASGVVVPQDKVDQANAAIDRLNQAKITDITVQFDNLARSISAGNVELQKLARTETAGFLTELISGTKSFDEIWKKTLDNIVQGMIKILAQKFTDKLFDGGDGEKGSGGGIAGAAINFIGSFIGFNDGGIIPGGQGQESLAAGQGPLATAIRREGAGATVVVGKKGERILNLEETAAYQREYPRGILNLNNGGIIGGSANSPGQAFSPSQSFGQLNGKFDIDLKSDGQTQTGISEQMGSKLTQVMRGLIAEELRPNGILHRFT